MHLLEVPGVFPGLGLQGHHGRAEQVVTFTHRAIVIRPAIADREVDEAEFGIERRRIPDRGATAHRMVGAGRPGLAAFLARTRQRKPAPHDLAGLGIERGQPAADAKLAARDPAVDHAVIVERRAGDAVAVLPLFDRRLPGDLAGLHVQRDDVGVELAEVDLSFSHRKTAIDPAAADRRDGLIDAGPVFPDHLAGLGVEREHVIVAGDDIHDAVLHERRRLEGIFAAEARALQARHPRALELPDIGGVDLLQRGIAIIGEIAAVRHPVLADRASKQFVDLGIGGPSGRVRDDQQAENEAMWKASTIPDEALSTLPFFGAGVRPVNFRV